jgi:hypothetical protein
MREPGSRLPGIKDVLLHNRNRDSQTFCGLPIVTA